MEKMFCAPLQGKTLSPEGYNLLTTDSQCYNGLNHGRSSLICRKKAEMARAGTSPAAPRDARRSNLAELDAGFCFLDDSTMGKHVMNKEFRIGKKEQAIYCN